MDRFDVRVRLNEDSNHHIRIHEIIEGLIAQRGYHPAIVDLVAAVHGLGEISLADPDNHAKHYHFSLWADAVRNAIQRHRNESVFERWVTESDRILARGLGIRID